MRSTFLVVSALLFVACGGGRAAEAPAASPTPPAASSASPTSAAVVPPGQAKVGDKTLCLVSKEEFVVKEDSPKVEYEGKTYYFCCSGCDDKFKADPKKYLGK